MKRRLALSVTLPALLLLALPIPSRAQQAEALDPAVARAGLSVKPPRNPVKSTAEIVKRSYERRPAKGLEVETGGVATTATTSAVAEIDVEVVHRADGTTEVRPCVPLPILFVVSSDQLLDETSRNNVDAMAGVLRDLCSSEGAGFSVQGHTSAEGGRAANQALSERRAARIHALLTAGGVEAKALTAIGLGEDAARVSENAPERERQQDRRVLIVRMR
jgi:outer membrane protein OmpA-like peptidoglycan-associated protein